MVRRQPRLPRQITEKSRISVKLGLILDSLIT
jgi:hypothetical protein